MTFSCLPYLSVVAAAGAYIDPHFCFCLEPLLFKVTCTLIYDYIISSQQPPLFTVKSQYSVLIGSGSGWCIYRSMIPIQSCFCQSFQPPSPFVWQLSTVENRNTRGFWEDFLLCILRYTYWPPPLPAPEYSDATPAATLV